MDKVNLGRSRTSISIKLAKVDVKSSLNKYIICPKVFLKVTAQRTYNSIYDMFTVHRII